MKNNISISKSFSIFQKVTKRLLNPNKKKSIKKGSIKRKLVASFLILLMLLTLNSILSIFMFNSISNTLDSLININMKQINTTFEMEIVNQDMLSNLQEYVFNSNTSALEKIYINVASLKKLKTFAMESEKLDGGQNDKGEQILNKLFGIYKDLDTVVDRIVNEANSNKFEEAKKIFLQNREGIFGNLKSLIATYTKDKNVAINEKNAQIKRNKGIIFTVIIFYNVFCFALSLILIISLIRKITHPIKELVSKAMLVENGDLTVTWENSANDEIGQLGKAFSEMVGTLRNILIELKQNADDLLDLSHTQSMSATQLNHAGEQISNSIQDIAQGSENQVRLTTSSCDLVEKMINDIINISKNVDDVTNISTKAGEYAISGNEIINQVHNQMNNINKVIVDSAGTVKKLEKDSENILNILQIITDITDETNLLALNAAIEAARAGEAGRGFAVVATEIRSLADESKKAANKIKDVIEKINRQINESVEISKLGIEQANSGVKIVNNANEAFVKILDDSKEIINRITSVSESSKRIAVDSKQVSDSYNGIVEVAVSASAFVQEVAASVEEQSATMSEMSAQAGTLLNNSESLKKIISKFKIE